MITTKLLLTSCEKIKSQHLYKYLKDNGWNQITFNKQRPYYCFQYFIEDELYQINVPKDESFSDYVDVVFDACKQISIVENKSIEEVVFELLNFIIDLPSLKKK